MKRTLLTHLALFLCFLFLIKGCNGVKEPVTLKSLSFDLCEDAASYTTLNGSLCAQIPVPLHHDADASAIKSDSINIFVRKFPADGNSQGSVWMLAGGPGQSGAMFYPFIDTIKQAFPGYDIVIPDHRGTGLSTRICPEEEAISSQNGSQLAGREFQSCYDHMRSNPDYVRAFSVTNAAKDIETLIKRYESRGETYLYGTSYGTQLAHRILLSTDVEFDGVVLDSMTPMQQDTMWTETKRAQITDAVGHKLLAKCDNDTDCRKLLGGNALARYKELLKNIESDEVELPDSVPGNDIKTFFGQLLDVPSARNKIPAIIKGLKNGETDVLIQAMDTLRAQQQLFDYKGFSLSIPLSNTILNSENNLRPKITAAELDQEKENLEFAHPLPYQLVAGRNANLPTYERDQYWGKHPDTIPPTLVLQGTMDPKTHYQGAQRHVERMEKAGKVVLVSVRNAPHAILMRSPDCFVRQIKKIINSGNLDDWCESKKVRLDFTTMKKE